MNDFATDDAWQRKQRDEILVPGYYERRFPGKYQLCDDLPDEQKRGIDTIVRLGARRWTIDEKIVRQRYDAFALETKSCTVPGREKTGWMFYGQADRLLYCFTVDDWLDCYMIDFPMLQKWFWLAEDSFATFQMRTQNMSAGRVVPIRDVDVAGCIIANFKVTPEGT